MNELGENEVNQTDTTGNEEVMVEEGDDFGDDFGDASWYYLSNPEYGTLGGMIEQPGDADVFKFIRQSGATYYVNVRTGDRFEIKLSIYDSQLNEVSYVDGIQDPLGGVFAKFTPTTTGVHFIKVSSQNINSYTISAAVYTDDVDGGLPADGLGITHNINQEDDTQFFTVSTYNIFSDVTVSFRSDLLASDRNVLNSNFSLKLYDKVGNLVSGEWVNAGDGVFNFNLAYTEYWNSYLLEVKALNENAYGTYTVGNFFAGQGQSLPPIPLNFTGTATDETLEGNAANNYLDGMGGLDTLLGKAGDDILESRSNAETIDGGEGNNTVSYQYATSRVNVNLSLSGSQNTQGGGMDTLVSIANINGSPFNDILTGDQSINSIQGLAGNDTINGGLGSDQLDGGEGQDTLSYAKSKAGVTVSLTTNEASGGDATGDIILDFEHVLGSNAKDSITGNLMANRLSGGNGYDTLNGSDGNDTLFGGAGRDILMGGNDKDALNGGASADRFVFKTLDDSVVGFSRDVITDFRPAQKDIIDVSAIDAIPGTGNNAFDFIGTNTFSKASGEVRYVFAGNQTLVQFDYDGDARADMEIALTGNIALSATDFFL